MVMTITTCVHGVDLRFVPRCYLCSPSGDGTLLESKPIRYRISGTLLDRSPGGRKYDVDLVVEVLP